MHIIDARNVHAYLRGVSAPDRNKDGLHRSSPHLVKPRIHTRTILTVAVLLLVTPIAPTAHAATDVHVEGRLPSGATCLMDVPAGWNGTVLLHSHGYTPVSIPNPAHNAPDDATKSLLLHQGYALIGSSYAITGRAATEAVPDQQSQGHAGSLSMCGWSRAVSPMRATARSVAASRSPPCTPWRTGSGRASGGALIPSLSTPVPPSPIPRPHDWAHPSDGHRR